MTPPAFRPTHRRDTDSAGPLSERDAEVWIGDRLDDRPNEVMRVFPGRVGPWWWPSTSCRRDLPAYAHHEGSATVCDIEGEFDISDDAGGADIEDLWRRPTTRPIIRMINRC